MQTLTFTQKLLRQRFFFNCLIPLLALFVGMGSVQAQTQTNVIIGSGSTATLNVKGTQKVYNAFNNNPTPSLANANLGIFTTGTDVLELDATALRAVSGTAFSAAPGSILRFRVYPSGTTAPAFQPANTITLQDDGTTTNPSGRAFSLSNANRDLLSGIIGDAAGVPYTIQFQYRLSRTDNTTSARSFANVTRTVFLTVVTRSTASLRNVIVRSGTSAATATTATYDANTSTPGPGVFNGTDFGALNLSTARLLLQGGTIEVQERNGDVYNQAQIAYVVSSGTLATPGAPFPSGQTLPLVETGYNMATMTRTFALSNAGRDMLALATSGGNPGTSYRFDVSVSAFGQNGNTTLSLNGDRQSSVFTATGIPTIQPTLTNTTILVAPDGGGNVSYDGSNVSVNPDFAGANLGSFDLQDGLLVLNGGTATTVSNGDNTIDNVTLFFRVRQNGTSGGGFVNFETLQQTGVVTDGNGTRTRTFALSNAARNLLSSATIPGGYRVDVYLQASGVNQNIENEGMDGSFIVTGPTYTANFTVTGTPIVTTVWTGGFNDNWFDPLNWDNGVPTAIKNAIIPNFASGNVRPYPNIYSDAVKPSSAQSTSVNPDGTVDIIPASPGFNNTNSGNAMVRNLTLQGFSQGNRSITRLIRGRLDVFGDFDNPQGSFIQRETTVISFKSQRNQTISGSINGFTVVEIDGGANSIKSLTGSFKVKAGGSLRFINGILQTNISLVSSNFVEFEGSFVSNNVFIPAAQLIGETETSWLRGFITTTQPVVLNAPQNFSNIGLTLTFTEDDPGNTTVTRNTGENRPETAFAGSTLNPNSDPKPSIRRNFGVQPANPTTQTRRLTANVAFRYLSNELVNLNRFNGMSGTTSLDQSKLSLYVSSTGGNSFNQLGRDSNIGNVLTKNGVTTFATFTLSEAAVLPPLPVTLSKFDVQRAGADALVTWATASEINSKGFSVQVSKDGKSFRTLGFVASASPNSSRLINYSFTDAEKNKAGLRYYRLEQVDIDGTLAYNAPKVVSFEGALTQGSVAFAYPNPYVNELFLDLNSAAAGQGKVSITDMTGRVIGQRTISLATGTNNVEVTDLANLKSGLYLMRVTMPSGDVQNVKVVKQ